MRADWPGAEELASKATGFRECSGAGSKADGVQGARTRPNIWWLNRLLMVTHLCSEPCRMLIGETSTEVDLFLIDARDHL